MVGTTQVSLVEMNLQVQNLYECNQAGKESITIPLGTAMLQRIGTVPHTEPVHVENGSSKIPYQVGTTEKYPTRNQHSRYWLHSSLNLYCACQHMSTWTQLSQGSSVTQPANDPASITVLDCPHISRNIFQGQDSTEVYLSILERSVG